MTSLFNESKIYHSTSQEKYTSTPSLCILQEMVLITGKTLEEVKSMYYPPMWRIKKIYKNYHINKIRGKYYFTFKAPSVYDIETDEEYFAVYLHHFHNRDMSKYLPSQEINDIFIKIKHDNECPICFENDWSTETLPYCPHYLHPSCRKKWEERHNICPLCRVQIDKDRVIEISPDTTNDEQMARELQITLNGQF